MGEQPHAPPHATSLKVPSHATRPSFPHCAWLWVQVNPMSFIMEQAGGKAVTGTGRALEVVPTKVHQRVPIYLGCVRDVDLVGKFLADAAADAAGAGGASATGAATGGAAGAGSA